MRMLSVLRALVIGAALTAPVAQAALANQQEQQAMTHQDSTAAPSYGGVYDGPAMSSTVGD